MTTPLRILLIEDSPTDAKLVLHELRKLSRPVESERVDTEPAMRAALDAGVWDFVLSDWSMPSFSAPRALAILAERGLDIPFVIVSGTIGEEAAVEAMRAGARDYVLKDRLGRLNPAIERELHERAQRLALRDSEARFERLADSGIISIAHADVHGNTYDCNDAYCELVGYSREEILSSAFNWSALTPPEWADADALATAQLQATGKALPFEKEMLRKDGSRVPILIGVALLEYPRVIVFIADLTAHRSERAARERAEATLRVTEEQLRQAQKMDAIGRLAGGVAHDFNNALSVILSYGEMLRDDLRPADPMRADLGEILAAASRAVDLTRQLLLFSRQQVVEPSVVGLNEVLAAIDRMLQRILGEDIELISVLGSMGGRILVDPGHLEQVIMNLVVNARDAMPTGGRLTIETRDVELDEEFARVHVGARVGPHVMLAVTDTGCGMDRATQTRIFEPFFTTKPTGQGTGLGLSTVFGIVQQSGGHVWVYSEPGLGTTFKVYLPRVDAEIELPRPAGATPPLRGTETILLVEDDDQVRGIALSALRRQGYHVLPARNAGEALLLCEQHGEHIALLVTDVVMPQMSGPELARRLAKLRPEMKLLCMSGYTDDAVVRHGALDAGIAFLQKPITPTALARKVREVLDG